VVLNDPASWRRPMPSRTPADKLEQLKEICNQMVA
jgi:hypothetical protein